MYFSIILPVYNVAAYLDRCIRSVLEQPFSDYELILVDDGSTDQSPEICDTYAQQYPHIRVIHKPNGGLSSARNAGLEEAKGTYVWWVDSDDWIERDALAVLHCALQDHKPDMIKFDHTRVEQSAVRVISGDVEPGLYCGEEIGVLRDKALLFTGKFCLSACLHLYRREFLQEHQLRFVSEQIVGSEDYLFNLQALLAAERIFVLDQALYWYEQRMGSLTQCYRKQLPERYTRLFQCLLDHYRDKGVLQDYRGKISSFFVWHLLHGTCIPNEYYVCDDHSLVQGRRNIRTFLGTREVQTALRQCEKRFFSPRQRIQLWAMGLRLEPLFYWLYVKKPEKKKGMRNEA